jgi:hypothetical protein
MRAILPSPDNGIGQWHSRGIADAPEKPEQSLMIDRKPDVQGARLAACGR